MKTFTIKATCKYQSDVELATAEVLRLVREDFITGHGSNEDGSFQLDSDGEYAPAEDDSGGK